MKHPVSISLRFSCLVLLVLGVLINSATAKPRVSVTEAKPVNSSQAIDFSELDRLVPEELKQKNTPGAVIAIVSGDQVVYQKAFGVANVETNAPMTTEMLFRLGSTTKMFTAAALVSLAEKDKIKLNEPI
ncbi:MAG TPA: serine hydrolase domain-containing protein, partial [Pyrinomonadaceae bacterium]|nr:serine hydrolase domain-containing protein [Pyrinomonadaceae bacterium]